MKSASFNLLESIKFVLIKQPSFNIEFKPYGLKSLYLQRLNIWHNLDLRDIEYLYIDKNEVMTIDDGEGEKMLENLNLNNLKGLYLIGENDGFLKAAKAPNLEEVFFRQTPEQKTIDLLGSMKKLHTLYIPVEENNLESLSSLEKIKTLGLAIKNDNSSLSFLEKLNSLESLVVLCESKSKFSPTIPALPQLRNLKLTCKINDTTKANIKQMKSIKNLGLNTFNADIIGMHIEGLELAKIPADEKDLELLSKLNLNKLFFIKNNSDKLSKLMLYLKNFSSLKTLGIKEYDDNTDLIQEKPNIEVIIDKNIKFYSLFNYFMLLNKKAWEIKPDIFNR